MRSPWPSSCCGRWVNGRHRLSPDRGPPDDASRLVRGRRRTQSCPLSWVPCSWGSSSSLRICLSWPMTQGAPTELLVRASPSLADQRHRRAELSAAEPDASFPRTLGGRVRPLTSSPVNGGASAPYIQCRLRRGPPGHRLVATGLRDDGLSNDTMNADYMRHYPGKSVHRVASLTYELVPGLPQPADDSHLDIDATVVLDPPPDPEEWGSTLTMGGERDARPGRVRKHAGPILLPDLLPRRRETRWNGGVRRGTDARRAGGSRGLVEGLRRPLRYS